LASIIYCKRADDPPMTLADALVLWVHLICSSIWVGGSIFIGIVLVPVLKTYTKSIDELVALMVKVGRRFNKITIPAFAILIATGIYNARSFAGDPSALLGSAYGEILLIKIALVIATIITYIVHIRVLDAKLEQKIMSGVGGAVYVQSVRSKIIHLGRVVVFLSVSILLLAAMLGKGGFLS
ncbi:MAG TPA: CopD family protein, partial [Nitrososphaera sp.]|nr:CopD family protein [Nitrososphaera sp.]